MLKVVIGGISGGVVIFLILIFFPIEIEMIQETVQEELMHPCQKYTLANLLLYQENAKLLTMYGSGSEEISKFREEFVKQEKEIFKQIKDHNCKDTQKEWHTSEFNLKMKTILEDFS